MILHKEMYTCSLHLYLDPGENVSSITLVENVRRENTEKERERERVAIEWNSCSGIVINLSLILMEDD